MNDQSLAQESTIFTTCRKCETEFQWEGYSPRLCESCCDEFFAAKEAWEEWRDYDY